MAAVTKNTEVWLTVGFAVLMVGAAVLFPHTAEAALASTTRATVGGGQSASGGDLTTGSFTPSDGSLLVAVYGGVREANVEADLTAGVGGGNWTWTKRASVSQLENSSNWRAWVTIWTTTVTTGASMTATSTNDGTMDGTFFAVYEYTGQDPVDPIGASGTAGREDTAGSWTFDLDASPAATSEVVAALSINNWTDSEGGAVTPGTGWHEFTDFTDTGIGADETRGEVQGRGNSTSAAVLWNEADCRTSGAQGACAAAALEIVAAASVSPPTVTTSAASSVTSSTATLNGDITDTGGETGGSTQHGFAYSTDPTLSTDVSTSTLGTYSGTGAYPEGISSLDPSTTYYFRAYASNSGGTGYGSILNFTTSDNTTRVMRLLGHLRLRGVRLLGL